MLETGRSRDNPGTACDAPGPEETQASADRGAVRTDARVRHEYALAYRATVHGVSGRQPPHLRHDRSQPVSRERAGFPVFPAGPTAAKR